MLMLMLMLMSHRRREPRTCFEAIINNVKDPLLMVLLLPAPSHPLQHQWNSVRPQLECTSWGLELKKHVLELMQ